jgi:hypothetical protein
MPLKPESQLSTKPFFELVLKRLTFLSLTHPLNHEEFPDYTPIGA